MRLIIRFAIMIALIVAVAPAPASGKRVIVDVGIKTMTGVWTSTHTRFIYERHLDQTVTTPLAEKHARIGVLYGPQAVAVYGMWYASGELLFGNYSYSTGGSSKLKWRSIDIGIAQRFPGGTVRATVGNSWFNADYTGLDPAHFGDHIVSELMLRVGVNSAPHAGFRYGFELGLPVPLITNFFPENYMADNGGLVDFQLSFGMRVRQTPFHWDVGYGQFLAQYPFTENTYLESMRLGLILKLGYEW